MEEYESVLLVKQEVFVYKIPPRTSNRGYRAADWKLDVPDWTGRLRVVAKGKECILKLEDKTSGELFAKCPVDKYPGIAVEAVMDSSRYFVIRIQNDNGRTAFIGIGFADRGDSFDLNVALQDHFKWLQKSEELEQGAVKDDQPQLDLRFKEGQTITINMNIAKKNGSHKARPKPSTTGGIPGLLPPPPGGLKMPPSPCGVKSSTQNQISPLGNSVNPSAPPPAETGLLLDFDSSPSVTSSQANNDSHPQAASDLWGDFAAAAASASGSSNEQSNTPKPADWVQF